MRLTAAFLILAGVVAASPLVKRDTTVQFDGRAFVNKGLQGFGRVKADAVDSYGETLGGLGSAIALESFKPDGKGGYIGRLRTQPDRGYNVQGTTPYRARSHVFSFTFDPKVQGPAENIQLKYLSTDLYRESPRFPGRFNFTTGADPNGIRPARGNIPVEPIDAATNHISFDSEGLVFLPGGLFAVVSDEYGPYLHVLSRQLGWNIVQSIRPPDAFVPFIDGKLNFTTTGPTPTSGRIPNQGFEGLSVDPKTGIVSALLQSATAQDSVGGSKTTNRYTRLLQYDFRSPLNPRLVGEYVVPLPVSSGKSPKSRAQSEIFSLGAEGTYLFLPRDGAGFGDSDSESAYKQVALFSTKGATNIAGTKYDSPANPVAPGGVLVADVTPANVSDFISLIDATQLAKFGLHNGGAFDRNLIAAKIESLAVAPVGDAANPQDYFVIAVSDNDFVTANGNQAVQDASGKYVVKPYSEPYAQENGDADTQVFIYRATLPGYKASPF